MRTNHRAEKPKQSKTVQKWEKENCREKKRKEKKKNQIQPPTEATLSGMKNLASCTEQEQGYF